MSLPRLGLYTLLILASVGAGLGVLRLGVTPRLMPGTLSLSAGIFLGLTFFYIAPEAFQAAGGEAGLYFLSGFFLIYALERYVMVHPCEGPDCETHALGYPAFVGLSLHSFADGIALGTSMMLPSGGLGFAVFLGILAHKAPQAFSLTTLLLRERFTWPKIVLVNLVLVSMIPVGALAAHAQTSLGGSHVLMALLAFSGGVFLHIALSDLIPEIHKAQGRRAFNLLFVLAGMSGMGGLRLVAGH